jgi:hypothetical protein
MPLLFFRTWIERVAAGVSGDINIYTYRIRGLCVIRARDVSLTEDRRRSPGQISVSPAGSGPALLIGSIAYYHEVPH